MLHKVSGSSHLHSLARGLVSTLSRVHNWDNESLREVVTFHDAWFCESDTTDDLQYQIIMFLNRSVWWECNAFSSLCCIHWAIQLSSFQVVWCSDWIYLLICVSWHSHQSGPFQFYSWQCVGSWSSISGYWFWTKCTFNCLCYVIVMVVVV